MFHLHAGRIKRLAGTVGDARLLRLAFQAQSRSGPCTRPPLFLTQKPERENRSGGFDARDYGG